jgi:hypothetical protein
MKLCDKFENLLKFSSSGYELVEIVFCMMCVMLVNVYVFMLVPEISG